MPYLPAATIAESIESIQRGKLVLPAIQREFVWKPAQITALFDSVMRGYPIGSFLSWNVEPDTASQFRFYGFMKDYNQLNQRHNPVLDVHPTQDVTAVLDGQQRLTSLNIGLRGSYAWKKKYGWSHFPENYPARVLHLNLAEKAAENAAGLEYDFRFLTSDQVSQMPEDEVRFWLPVPEVANSPKFNGVVVELSKRGIANDPDAMEMASDLWEKIHSEKTVHFYEENNQDIERVLDIFIRVNSGGTPLSYSDLLLSIATAQWKDRDAREEIHGLVDSLNAVGAGFRFTQDLILKTGLVLADIGDIGFKVKNFTAENMQILSDEWDQIASSLRVAVGLLSDFGLSGPSLTARSVLIPIATYVHHRGLTQSYRESPAESHDRARLREWVLRSLVIPGVWGSGLDVLLRALREVIRKNGSAGFPAEQIESAMAGRGKSLAVSPELVDNLLELQYGDASTFAVLAIMFPHVNTRNNHHVDHVFPISRLSNSDLKSAGIDSDIRREVNERKNSLPNLELLEGLDNISKSARMPAVWAQESFSNPEALLQYLNRNALPQLPAESSDFLRFYEERRDLMRERLLEVLGAVRQREVADPSVQDSVPPIDEAIEAESIAE